MCGIEPSMIPKEPVMTALRLLSWIMPKAAVIPGDQEVNSKSIKDTAIRTVAVSDPLEYNGRTRLRMGLELIKGCTEVSAVAEQIAAPLLLCPS